MIYQNKTVAAFLALTSVFAIKFAGAETCLDWTGFTIDLGDKCNSRTLEKKIKGEYKIRFAAESAAAQAIGEKKRCKGGFKKELKLLTNTTDHSDAVAYLHDICLDALSVSAASAPEGGWDRLSADVDIDEFFDGDGFLNNETGNFQQKNSSFTKRGGYDRFNYVGEDPTKNDHYPTSAKSYAAGQAVMQMYEEEASNAYLAAPTGELAQGCPETHAAVCCWERDRQYFDNNGNCAFTDCARQDPGDNTDLCWATSKEGAAVPYPGDAEEGDLHCHGLAFSDEEGDINSSAKWNNLFFVSFYDHMFTRGYVNSINDYVPMCDCVEKMDSIAVARADCTEAIGHSNFTLSVVEGSVQVEPVENTFYLEFQACEGYDYDDTITPSQFQNEFEFNADDAGLTNSNNDLSAFMFRSYLEGKVDTSHIERYEQVVIGYRNPEVNDGDDERDEVCKAKFEEKFGQPFDPETEAAQA